MLARYMLMTCVFVLSAMAGFGARAQAGKAEFVEAKFSLHIAGQLRGEPTAVFQIGKPGVLAAADGINAYRIEAEIRSLYVDEKGRTLAELRMSVFDAVPSGWLLVGEPQAIVKLGGGKATIDISADDPSKSLSVDVELSPIGRQKVETLLGGAVGVADCNADDLKGSPAKSSCCGGRCSDGRRWQCCNVVSCCNVCSGAGCCQPP